jgi:acetyl esterase
VPNDQARTFLSSQPRHNTPIQESDVPMRRAEMRAECLTGGRQEPVASVTDVQVGGVRTRLYQPVGGEREVLVWLHGGGWMLGDLDCCDAVVRALANRGGCAVLAVDYRLTPEHRYPAAVHDSWAVTEWAGDNFDLVAVGGDSAGGNLTAAMALRARDLGISLALQLLVYPVLDYRPDSPYYDEFRDRYRDFAGNGEFGKQSQENVRRLWEIYIPDPARRGEYDASPLRAASFSRLAPAMVITAEHDILTGEGQDYVRRLYAAGVPAQIINYTGQVHGFFGLSWMDDAKDAIARSGAALRRAFSAGESR